MAHLRAWARWQMAAGPWRGWAVCPALNMPAAFGASPSSTVPRADLGDLEDVLAGGHVAGVLDLEPGWGVRVAAEVSRRGLAHAVLVLPRWPHSDAVLVCDELVATLVATSRHLRSNPTTTSVVFVLDGQRQQSIRRPTHDPRVDNRYALAVGDLPNVAALRSMQIQRVVKIAQRT